MSNDQMKSELFSRRYLLLGAAGGLCSGFASMNRRSSDSKKVEQATPQANHLNPEIQERKLIRELYQLYPELGQERIAAIVNDWGLRSKLVSDAYGVGGLLAIENFPQATSLWLAHDTKSMSTLCRFVETCGVSKWPIPTRIAWESTLINLIEKNIVSENSNQLIRRDWIRVDTPLHLPVSIRARSYAEIEAIRRYGDSATRVLTLAQASDIRLPVRVAETLLRSGNRLSFACKLQGPALALALTPDHRTPFNAAEIFQQGLRSVSLGTSAIDALISSNFYSVETALKAGWGKELLIQGVERIATSNLFFRGLLSSVPWSVVTASIVHNGTPVGLSMLECSPCLCPWLLETFWQPMSTSLLGLVFHIVSVCGETGAMVLLNYGRSPKFNEVLHRLLDDGTSDSLINRVVDSVSIGGLTTIDRLLAASSFATQLDWEASKQDSSSVLPINFSMALHAMVKGAQVSIGEALWAAIDDIGAVATWASVGALSSSMVMKTTTTTIHSSKNAIGKIVKTILPPAIETSLRQSLATTCWLDDALAPLHVASIIYPLRDNPPVIQESISEILNHGPQREKCYHDLGEWLLAQGAGRSV